MSERATEGQVVMPFYIICDVSGSMAGDIDALNEGVVELRVPLIAEASTGVTWADAK